MKTIYFLLVLINWFTCIPQETNAKNLASLEKGESLFFSQQNTPVVDGEYYCNSTIEISNITINSNSFFASDAINLLAGENGLKNTVLTPEKTIRFSINSNKIEDSNEAKLNTETSSDASANNIILFPNPARNDVTIKWQNLNIKRVSLLTMEGKILIKKTCDPNSFTINLDVENYPSGSYSVLLFSNDNQVFNRTMIKK